MSNQAAMILYKYRSLTDWKFLIDILMNNQLFAAGFESLNDPMEGRYYHPEGQVEQTAMLHTET